MEKKKKLTERDKLIRYIKANDIFYTYVDFSGHSDEQLREIKTRLNKAVAKTKIR